MFYLPLWLLLLCTIFFFFMLNMANIIKSHRMKLHSNQRQPILFGLQIDWYLPHRQKIQSLAWTIYIHAELNALIYGPKNFCSLQHKLWLRFMFCIFLSLFYLVVNFPHFPCNCQYPFHCFLLFLRWTCAIFLWKRQHTHSFWA